MSEIMWWIVLERAGVATVVEHDGRLSSARFRDKADAIGAALRINRAKIEEIRAANRELRATLAAAQEKK